MRVFPKDTSTDVWRGDPGSWRDLPGVDGARSATVICPDCRKWCTLTHHTIAGNGVVSPSLACPWNSCTFHDHIKLEDW